MKNTISCLQMQNPGSPEHLEPVSLSYLVELSVVAPQGQDKIQEDMKNFAEQLKPYPFNNHIFSRKSEYRKDRFRLLNS